MIDLIPVTLTGEKKTELAGRVYDAFWAAVRARQSQVDNSYVKWTDNYNAKPQEEVRSSPFYNASNFVPQLIRMHVDILMARIAGIVFATKPFWKPSAILSDVDHTWIETLSDAMQWVSFYDIPGFQRTMFSVIKRCFKSGTTVLKYPWVSESTWVQREAGKSTEVKKEFLDFRTIPFDDFWVLPITIMSLDDASHKFQRIRLTKDKVEERRDTGWWDKEAVAKLLLGGDQKIPQLPDAAREAQASEAGIELKRDAVQPFSAIETWVTYPTESGRPHRIIVVFNPQVRGPESLLKVYYDPYEEAPFADFHMMPREELFFDYCVPEILEQAQEEQAQIHNGRRDASTITNTPGWKKKRGANVPNPASTWYPNKVFELDNMDDLEVLQLRPQYSAMLEEESSIMQQAERYTGVTPPMQGYGAGVMSGKRGIYNTGGTLALLAEGNRRLDLYIKQLRDPMHRVGRGIFTSYRDYGQSRLERFQRYPKYAIIQQLFAQSRPGAEASGGLFFELAASEASVNKEHDRTALLLMANTLAAYYQRVFEGAGVVAQLPEGNPVRELMLLILDGARDLASRILYSFDIPDRTRLTPDVRAVLAGGAGSAERESNAAGLPGDGGALSIEQLQQFSQNTRAVQTGDGRPNGRPS